MKKWICGLLCLSIITSMTALNSQANAEDNSNNIQAMSIAEQPKAETPTTETNTVESAKPSASPTASPAVSPRVSDTPSVSPSATPSMIPVPTEKCVVKDEKVFTVTKDETEETCVITGYTGDKNVSTLYVPSKVDGYKVTEIADHAFENCFFIRNLVVKTDIAIAAKTAFSTVTPIEIWGKKEGKAATFASEQGLVFHALEGSSSIKATKKANMKAATVTWSEVTGATSYNVYKKKNKGKFSLVGSSKTTSYESTKLKVGAEYTYKVTPVFTAKDGDTIEGFESKTAAVSMIPGKLKGVKAYGIRGGIQVVWNKNKNMTGYQVYMKVHVKGFKTNFNCVKTIKTNKTTGYRCKMLVRGMKYSYKVRGYKKVGGKKIYGEYTKVTTKAK